MLALLKNFPLEKYSSRAYVVAATDKMSAQKAEHFELSHQSTPSPVQQVCNPLNVVSDEPSMQLHTSLEVTIMVARTRRAGMQLFTPFLGAGKSDNPT